jgi:diguanylate cyclase (GGDEF)-like protein/PAS domain S-box-containing protein
MKNGLAWAALGGAEPGSHSFHPLDANTNVHVGWSHELLTIQSDVLAAMGDLRKVMELVVEGALRVIPNADGAAVEIRDGEDLVLRAASGSCAGSVGARLPYPASLSWACVQNGNPQICLDSETDPRVDRDACRRIGARSMIMTPLMLQGTAIGVLKVIADTPAAFENRDLLSVQLLAGPIAIGLASAAQADASKRFAATFDQAAVGIAHVAPDGRFLMVNNRFCGIVGREQAELLTSRFQQITHPDDLELDLKFVAALVAGRIDHYAMEKRYLRKDGDAIWVNLTVSLVRQQNGSPDFFVSVIEDISARKAAEEAAMQDALTELPNRRALLQRLNTALDRSRADGTPLCVAYLDLDGFKGVNDRLGHAEGDKCLIAVANALKAGLRKNDIVGRMAGDEFVVLLPDTSRIDALAIADRLRKAVSAIAADSGWDLSISVGGVITGTATTAEQALIVADRVMYEVKRRGGACQIIDCMDWIAPLAA